MIDFLFDHCLQARWIAPFIISFFSANTWLFNIYSLTLRVCLMVFTYTAPQKHESTLLHKENGSSHLYASFDTF